MFEAWCMYKGDPLYGKVTPMLQCTISSGFRCYNITTMYGFVVFTWIFVLCFQLLLFWGEDKAAKALNNPKTQRLDYKIRQDTQQAGKTPKIDTSKGGSKKRQSKETQRHEKCQRAHPTL